MQSRRQGGSQGSHRRHRPAQHCPIRDQRGGAHSRRRVRSSQRFQKLRISTGEILGGIETQNLTSSPLIWRNIQFLKEAHHLRDTFLFWTGFVVLLPNEVRPFSCSSCPTIQTPADFSSSAVCVCERELCVRGVCVCVCVCVRCVREIILPACLILRPPNSHRPVPVREGRYKESSLLTTYWSESTLSS